MRSAEELSTAILEFPGIRYQGFVTRYVDSSAFELGEKNCFYDLGPQQDGKRYTPNGGGRGIYAAEDVYTAGAEVDQLGGLSALRPNRIATRQRLDMQVTLSSVLDLGNANLRQRLKTSLQELRLPWRGGLLPPYTWPATWSLGDAVFKSERFDGIRFPSSKLHRRYCLLILTERLGNGAELLAERPGEGIVACQGNFKLKS
jgi:RES domain-containing protein